MAGPDANLGTATVTVKVDTTEVKPALDQTQAEVTTTTQAIGTDAEKNIGGGFRKVGESISEATAPVRKLASSITATVGIATGLIGAFVGVRTVLMLIAKVSETIRDHYAEMAKLSKLTADQLDRQASAVREQRASTVVEANLQDKLAGLEKARIEAQKSMSAATDQRIERETKSLGVTVDGLLTSNKLKKAIDEQIAATKTQLAQLTARLGEEKKALEQQKEITAELLKQKDAIKAQEDAYFSLAQRVAEFRAQRAKDREEEEQAEKAADAERRRRTREAIREETLDRIKSIRERHDEELRLEKERERNAKAQAEAVAKAIENVNDRITSLNDSTSNTLEALLRRVEVFVDNHGYG